MARKRQNEPALGITEQITPAGSTVYSVRGTWRGVRIRKSMPSAAEAIALRDAIMGGGLFVSPAARLVSSRLTPVEQAAAEHAVDMAAGRWSLSQICAAGLESMRRAPGAELVAPLAEEWFRLVAGEVNRRWAMELRARVLQFLRDQPSLSTQGFTQAVFREWLDGLTVGQQTKANLRNCVHRFAGWLVERGKLTSNPAAGIRISKRSKAGGEDRMPSVMTAAQVEAFMRALEMPHLMRLKGWAALCLFAGLRPGGRKSEGEAPRLRWSEINFKTGELSVQKRKRGAGVRIFKLSPQALAWLLQIQREGQERPGQFWINTRLDATEAANEELTTKGLPPIVWDEDILRHTHASVRASEGVPVYELAADMGTSASMIYGHYRHPRDAAEVAAFRKVLPSI